MSWRREDPFDRLFRELFEAMIKRLSIPTPESLFDEITRDFDKFNKQGIRGPFIYGFSMKLGPDGKPIIREFGNVKKLYGRPLIEEEREPLSDVFEDANSEGIDYLELRFSPLFMAEKHSLDLDDLIIVTAQTGDRRYYKEIQLPAKVVPTSAKAHYKNGVLELKFDKVQRSDETGHEIKIE